MKKLLLLITLASLYFLALYQFDNKYTLQAPQAANGILAITEDDLNSHPLRYLCNGWAFYPDVLLSPEDFAKGSPNLYMNYITIGQYPHFDRMGTRQTSHGSGTYVLTLLLPNKLTTYALELPEIFSAYRLYIDDTLALEMGNPNPECYTSSTQSRLITFEKTKKVTLILAVTDYSHFYSGLVYPPAFGLPYEVNRARDLRLGLCLMCTTITLIVALLSLYLGLHMKHRDTCFFALLCLAMFCFTSYTLLNAFFALPIMPWYPLELTCGYIISFLVIVLHNRICRTPLLLKKTSNTFSFIFVLISFIFGFSSSYLNLSMLKFFSDLVLLYKILVALFLIVVAYYSIKRSKSDHKPLFYATVLYGTSFAWDRILPDYEPIYSGWFLEWGSLILVLAIGYTLWRDVANAYAYSLSFAEEHRQISRQLDMQLAYSKQLTQLSEKTRRLTHDFRQHLRTIGTLALNTQDRELLNYLEQVTTLFAPSNTTTHISFSENPALDALLRYYHNSACENNIQADFHFGLLQPLALTDIECCTVLGNLLENAIEACKRQNTGERMIKLTTKETSQTLYILIENTYNGIAIKKNKHFISQKTSSTERIGIGLASVQETLSRYHGTLDIYPKAHLFSIVISLPLLSSPTSKPVEPTS